MLVVSDTSPVTALLQVGRGGLLPSLFRQVLIPPAVETELLRFHLALPDYVESRPVQDLTAVDALCGDVDRGEAEAIVLAEECHADYLLIDEKRGRSVAVSRGLRVVGLLGALLMAKKAGLMPSVGDVMSELQSRAGFFVSDEVRRIILHAAGEGT